MTEQESGGRSTRRRWTRVTGVGLLLPLLAALVLVWSTADRQQRLDRVPVAIVNNDTIVTKPSTVAAGRALAASLTDPTDADPTLAWTLTTADDATTGLRRGTYYAVLTIPSDFSSAIVSTSSDKPVRGKLTLQSNGAASTTVPYISEQVTAAAATALGNQSTQGYLKNVYGGFNQIAKSNQQAADSAAQLADGTQQLAAGAVQVDEGAESLASGLDQVATGSEALAAGTAEVRAGTASVARGSRELAQGARSLERGADALARSARDLARRGQDFAGRARTVARGSAKVSAGAGRVSNGVRVLRLELRALTTRCRAAGGSPQFCADLRRTHRRALALALASRVLDRATGGVARATGGVADGAAGLAAAERRLARGARSLDSSSARLTSSAADLSTGATSVVAGATEVDDSARTLAGGAAQSAAAGTSLAAGSATLSSSADATDSGAQSLSSGLAQGAAQSPTYSSSEQTALADTVSQPVDLTHSTEHTAHGNGWLLAVLVALVLWLTALAATLGLDVRAARRHALAPVSSRRIAVRQSGPVLGMALVQAAAVLLALWVRQVSLASTVGFVLLTVLAAVCFSLLAHALRLALGKVGVALFVLFLLVQVAALGNVVPLETAPALLRELNGLLPLTAYTNLASQLVSGGDVGSAFAVVVVLAVWTLGAFGATIAVVKRQRIRPVVGPVTGAAAGLAQ